MTSALPARRSCCVLRRRATSSSARLRSGSTRRVLARLVVSRDSTAPAVPLAPVAVISILPMSPALHPYLGFANAVAASPPRRSSSQPSPACDRRAASPPPHRSVEVASPHLPPSEPAVSIVVFTVHLAALLAAPPPCRFERACSTPLVSAVRRCPRLSRSSRRPHRVAYVPSCRSRSRPRSASERCSPLRFVLAPRASVASHARSLRDRRKCPRFVSIIPAVSALFVVIASPRRVW